MLVDKLLLKLSLPDLLLLQLTVELLLKALLLGLLALAASLKLMIVLLEQVLVLPLLTTDSLHSFTVLCLLLLALLVWRLS